MTVNHITDPLPRVEDLTAYLKRLGWKRIEHRNDRLLVFTGPPDDEGNPLRAVLPARNDFDDSPRRIAEVIQLLAAVQRTAAAEVAQAARALDRDILRLRIVNGPGYGSSLSFDVAVRLIASLRDLIATAASAEEDPRPYFVKATAIARKHVSHCRFGHTFAGSFGFTVESPITSMASSTLPSFSPSAPFERRVMERVARGLSIAQDAVLGGDVAGLVEGYERGLNANMCDALLEMPDEIKETDVEYSVIWSPEIAPPGDLAIPKRLRVEPKTYQYLESAARELRKVGESTDVLVEGRVIQLRSDHAPIEEEESLFGPEERTVTILREQKDQPHMRLRVSLPSVPYREACDAHKDGRRVSVRGTLEKAGKFWTLMTPRDFRVLL